MAKDENKKKEELTQEQEIMKLRAVNDALTNQLQALAQKLEEFQKSTFFTKMEWLWRIIIFEESEAMFGKEFFNERVEEFKKLFKEEPAKKVKN